MTTPADAAFPAGQGAGIVGWGTYLPYWRLSRAAIAQALGIPAGRGTRSVAGYDEDTTTLGVEAARVALGAPGAGLPHSVVFSTPAPAYLDKTNATTIHAALRLPTEVGAFDLGGALRSSTGALLGALRARDTTVVASADTRDGLPGSSDEAAGGDAAAALVVGPGSPAAPVLAQYLGGASVSDELVERWRRPGERRSKLWEERFGESRYVAMGRQAWARGLKAAGLEAADVGAVAIAGMHARAVRSLRSKLGVDQAVVVDDLGATVGQAGTAHPAVLLAAMVEAEAAGLRAASTQPGKVLALVHLADGADVVFLRTTEALGTFSPARPLAAQLGAGAELGYAKFLSWRGMLTPEPPRRPEPQRVSSSAAWRAEDWKFGFVGSKDRASGAVHLPPARVSMKGGAMDQMDPVAMADAVGTVVTYTVDRLAYSPSPPVVFAVVDFEGGGRFPLELTDVDAEALAIGDKIEMTFRRLFTADDIHDYFWKGRPVPGAQASETNEGSQ